MTAILICNKILFSNWYSFS